MVKQNQLKITIKVDSFQRRAINEKVDFLLKYVNKEATLIQLADLNTKRRLGWLEENKRAVKNYSYLSLPEIAHRMLYLEHMMIIPEHSVVEKISDKKIRVKSHNFCPYLEACKLLGLDTKLICKEVGEPSCNHFVKEIDPRLKFYRDYSKIRPYHHYCEEFIEMI